MSDTRFLIPDHGEKITLTEDGSYIIPDSPIVFFIEGDGIGPDIMSASMRVWDAAVEATYGDSRKIAWMEIFAGEKAAKRYDGNYLPEETLTALRDYHIGIKGPLTTPVGGGHRSLNVTLRQTLDLYACIRPVRYFEGVPSPLKSPKKTDIVIFRENTEDVYAGIEYQAGTEENTQIKLFLQRELGVSLADGSGIGIKPISKDGSQRLIRKAIQYAIDNERKSVTLVHKGNIQKYTEGAFRNWGYDLAQDEFAEIIVTEKTLWDEFDGEQPEGKIVLKDRIADIMFQHLLLIPEQFDVIATTNLNGDYLSDAAAAQVGGVGIAPGVNLGDDVALFEATHGTAPPLANQNRANPGSLLLSGKMMLEYMGWHEAANLITSAYERTLLSGILTEDLTIGLEGVLPVGTAEFADAVIANLSS